MTAIATDNNIKRLQLIIEAEQSRTVTAEEAAEIGSALMRLFENLLTGSSSVAKLPPEMVQ